MIRVLVVADPARDSHLPGAELEGVEVADLFDHFNRVYEHTRNRVEVIRLFGPDEATRTNVLRRLMLRAFDVLHFAGHCVYDPSEKAASGWVFSNGERLSANERRRIDRIPKFFFSNACESGITPDRSEKRSVDLAPTFAESFFERGVSNFVCTAWPVDDAAARAFALKLYQGLLGLEPADETPQPRRYKAVQPVRMHVAMREARLAIIDSPGGSAPGARTSITATPISASSTRSPSPTVPRSRPKPTGPPSAPAPPGSRSVPTRGRPRRPP
jgi:hypothetical protein